MKFVGIKALPSIAYSTIENLIFDPEVFFVYKLSIGEDIDAS